MTTEPNLQMRGGGRSHLYKPDHLELKDMSIRKEESMDMTGNGPSPCYEGVRQSTTFDDSSVL